MRTLRDLVFSLSKNDFTPIISKKQGKLVSVSSGELFKDVSKLSEAFTSNGFSKGDKVALFADNSPLWLPAVLGINNAGLVDVPRGTDSTDEELRYILQHSESTFVIVENEQMMRRVKNFAPKTVSQIVTLTPSESSLQDFKETPSLLKLQSRTLPELQSDDLASIIYTSGTTANPKGVMLSHGNYIANVLSLQKYLGDISQEKFLSLLPPWHSFGRGEKHLALLGKSQMFYTTPKNFVADAKEQSPSIIVSVPRLWETVYEKLQSNPKMKKVQKIPLPFLKKKLISLSLYKALGGNVKYIISGGGGLPEHIDKFFLQHGVEILEGYGMTEMAPVISARIPGSKKSSLQTVGKPMPEVTVQIRDDQNTILPANTQGIIYVAGKNMMQGYYKDLQETKNKIGADNYLNTGDTGYIKLDGNIVITGRQKEEIVLSNGENIQPKPLEDLLKSHPLIADAMVVGEHWDENAKKFIHWKKLGALVVVNVEALKEKYVHLTDVSYDSFFKDSFHLQRFFQEYEIKDLFKKNKGFKSWERIYGVQFIPPMQVGKELTLSYKLKRTEILQNYHNQSVQKLYSALK